MDNLSLVPCAVNNAELILAFVLYFFPCNCFLPRLHPDPVCSEAHTLCIVADFQFFSFLFHLEADESTNANKCFLDNQKYFCFYLKHKETIRDNEAKRILFATSFSCSVNLLDFSWRARLDPWGFWHLCSCIHKGKRKYYLQTNFNTL